MPSLTVLVPMGDDTVIRNYTCTPADALALNEAVDQSREHLLPWMPWAAGPPMTLDERLDLLATWVAHERDTFLGVFDRDGRVVAGTGAHDRNGPDELEIGYWVRADSVRRGLATQISEALTTAVFSLAPTINRVLIKHDVANVPSGRVPARLGFAKVGEYTHEIEAPGEKGIMYVWAMERTSWETRSWTRGLST